MGDNARGWVSDVTVTQHEQSGGLQKETLRTCFC